MLTQKQLQEANELFNKGLLKIQDAVAFGLNDYILNCNDGRLTNIEKEVEGKWNSLSMEL